jgi:glycosyltransferase involved in cell wall biosynthesis
MELKRTDILYLHEAWTQSNLMAASACRRAGVPYVVMPHGAYEPEIIKSLRGPQFLRRAAERRLLERSHAAHIFFESEAARVSAIARVPDYIVAPTVAPVEEQWQWAGGGGYLAWFGRYDPTHKGLDLAIKGLAMIPTGDRPRLRLRGYDYKGGKDRVKAIVEAARVEDEVEVGGEVRGAEKADFLRSADAYIHPSRWESHSIALLEVLAHGVPAIVSRSIHIASLLEAAQAAVVVPPTSLGWREQLGSIDRAPLGGVGAAGAALARGALGSEEVARRYGLQLDRSLLRG